MLLALLFLAMIAAPCVIALQSSRKTGEEELEEMEIEMLPKRESSGRRAVATQMPERVLTLEERLADAEAEALVALEVAREAHWAALAATARAAALRADCAAQAAVAAEQEAFTAIQRAEAEFAPDYLPGDHPSLDFPRSRARRPHAA